MLPSFMVSLSLLGNGVFESGAMICKTSKLECLFIFGGGVTRGPWLENDEGGVDSLVMLVRSVVDAAGECDGIMPGG